MSIDWASRVCASARQHLAGERAPQSNYVLLHNNGSCFWFPMFEESVSHCTINVAWFPFDDQQCSFVFASWKYRSSQLAIHSTLSKSTVEKFEESEQWLLLGT